MSVSHIQVLELYKEYIDPKFTYTNFTIEEQNKILAAKRSNNELDATKLNGALAKIGSPVMEVHDAFRACFAKMKAGLIAKHGPNYHSHLPKKFSAK